MPGVDLASGFHLWNACRKQHISGSAAQDSGHDVQCRRPGCAPDGCMCQGSEAMTETWAALTTAAQHAPGAALHKHVQVRITDKSMGDVQGGQAGDPSESSQQGGS